MHDGWVMWVVAWWGCFVQAYVMIGNVHVDHHKHVC